MNLKCDCHWRGVIIQCHSCVSPYQLNTWNCGSDVWNVLKLKVGVITSQIKPEMSLTCVSASTPTLGSFVGSDRRAVDYIPVWKWITDTRQMFRMPPSLFDFFLKCKRLVWVLRLNLPPLQIVLSLCYGISFSLFIFFFLVFISSWLFLFCRYEFYLWFWFKKIMKHVIANISQLDIVYIFCDKWVER